MGLLHTFAISDLIVDYGVKTSKNNDGGTKNFQNPLLNSINAVICASVMVAEGTNNGRFPSNNSETPSRSDQ